MEELQARHRKEQKDLQGRVTQKKKNATKKTRRGVNDECDRLEQELKERQQAEINALDGGSLQNDLENLQIHDPTEITSDEKPDSQLPDKAVSFASSTKSEDQDEHSEVNRSRKPNRQKARLARRAAEQDAQVVAAQQEAAHQPDLRTQETIAMDQHRKKLGLNEIFIRPDGHCLFSACAKGLQADIVKESGPYTEAYQNVRYAAADFMSKHRDDFEAFMEEPFESHVKKIKDTAEWGGQLELQAIAGFYGVNIHVLQSNGRVEKIQPNETETAAEDLWLAYYRHSFGLGEHYNALIKA